MRTAAALFLITASALAIAPPYVNDLELAKFPILVVARWDTTPIEDHSKVEGNVLKHAESRTSIIIERVIRGDIKPGRHTLMLGFRMGWMPAGGPVIAFWSTETVGDAEEVKESNLWFLRQAKSWDPDDAGPYLQLVTERAVQSLHFEAYYAALASEEPRAALAKLLLKPDAALARRMLMFVTDGDPPWPYRSVWARGEPELRRMYGPEVKRLLAHTDPGVRAFAASVHNAIGGEDALPSLRALLADPDPQVRGIAAGALAGRRDEQSIAAIARAAAGVGDATLACEVIERLGAWGRIEFAPTLIAYLQNDEYAGFYGDDIEMPALKAQRVLKEISGVHFPLDVAAAMRAWATDKTLELPDLRAPFRARLLDREGTPVVRITNRADRGLALPRAATLIDVEGPGMSRRDYGQPKGRGAFVWLEPGGVHEIVLESDGKPLVDRASATKVALFFLGNGNQWGWNAWMGRIEVELPR